jgi:hypothetical protein
MTLALILIAAFAIGSIIGLCCIFAFMLDRGHHD